MGSEARPLTLFCGRLGEMTHLSGPRLESLDLLCFPSLLTVALGPGRGARPRDENEFHPLVRRPRLHGPRHVPLVHCTDTTQHTKTHVHARLHTTVQRMETSLRQSPTLGDLRDANNIHDIHILVLFYS